MDNLTPDITLSFDDGIQLLDALRHAGLFTLLGSEKQYLLGDEDKLEFKPWKFEGHEEEQATKETEAYRLLLRRMCEATGTPYVEAS
jgi:hypothetical protein